MEKKLFLEQRSQTVYLVTVYFLIHKAAPIMKPDFEIFLSS